MENRKNNKKIVIYAILFIATLSVGIVIGININAGKQTNKSETSINKEQEKCRVIDNQGQEHMMTLEELDDELKSKDYFDKVYKGGKIEITGVVDEIEDDHYYSNPYEKVKSIKINGLTRIQINYPTYDFSNIRHGDKITINGVISSNGYWVVVYCNTKNWNGPIIEH